MTILKVDKITKRFGGLIALRDVEFILNEKELVGLIGPNGAGKSTLFNVISGFYKATSGRVIFYNEDITGLKPHRIVAKGLVRTFQQTKLFMELTVLENVEIACIGHEKLSIIGDVCGAYSVRRKKKECRESALEIINLTGLNAVIEVKAKNLPHGFQRMLGIAIALAARPKLLCLDEPVTGMNFEESNYAMNLCNRLREQGITILLVEHTMKVVMGICDRIIVLNFGEKIAEGTSDGVRNNEQVIEAYLGRGF